MEVFDSHFTVILLSAIIILSYLFHIVSKKTNIPSVLMLIVLGVLLSQGIGLFGGKEMNLNHELEVLGIIGLIMIVLEAALDLNLKKEKKSIITKAFFSALVSLILTCIACAMVIHFFIEADIYKSLLHGIPLSIISSAVIIPSVGALSNEKEEFLVYESTFSDILGIMFFYFLIGYKGTEDIGHIAMGVSLNILITILIAVGISFLLVIAFQKIRTHLKFFLLLAVLLLLYSIGKLFHLSSLLIILIFGLMINNYKKLLRFDFLKQFIDSNKTEEILSDLKLVTLESTFVIRTFFFVIFGMTIPLTSLVDIKVFLISTIILLLIYGVRFLSMKTFRSKDMYPEIYIAPRGLITILLFYGIPAKYSIEGFDKGILLYAILATSIIMTISLIRKGMGIEPVDMLKRLWGDEGGK